MVITRYVPTTQSESMTHKTNKPLPLGYLLGEYRIDSMLGHGGFGITYLASDTQLGAQVAIKEYFPERIAHRNEQHAISADPASDAASVDDYRLGLQQFLKEARALAKFKHHNIVRVLRFMETNGSAYMVMEYETGQSLSRHLMMRGNYLDEPALLKIFLPILNGLRAVHDAGLLHSDIKPGNIYLRADGSPMLIDFGSARQRYHDQDSTRSIALTPAYAAIELYPKQGEPGPWTDIYSIGASMFCCINGTHPLGGLERFEVLRRHQPDPQTPATQIKRAGYSPYLLECIDWAMEIYPRNRPQNARDLQEGLMGKGRPQPKNEPVTISPPPPSPPSDQFESSTSAPTDYWKLTQWTLAVLVLAAVATVGIAYWPSRQMPVLEPATRPSADEIKADNKGSGSLAAHPQAATETPSRLATGLMEKGPMAPPEILAHTLNGHADWVNAVTFLTGRDMLASGAVDGSLNLWSLETGTRAHSLRGHRRAVNSLAASPDGRWLASAGDEGRILLWDVAGGSLQEKLEGHDSAIHSLAFSPDGKWLASAGNDRTVILWDLTSGRAQHILPDHKDVVYALAFSPDGKWLASAGNDTTIRLWEMTSGTSLGAFRGQAGRVLSLAFSPDGKWLASAGYSGLIKIWNVHTGKLRRNLNSTSPTNHSIAFSPDGRWLAVGGSNNMIPVWDMDTGTLHHQLQGHQGSVTSVAYSADGRRLASAGRDNTVRIWEAR